MLVNVESAVILSVTSLNGTLRCPYETLDVALDINQSLRNLLLSILIRSGTEVPADLASSNSVSRLYQAACAVDGNIPNGLDIGILEEYNDTKATQVFYMTPVTGERLRQIIDLYNRIYVPWVTNLPKEVLIQILDDVGLASKIGAAIHAVEDKYLLYIVGTEGITLGN